MKTGDILLVSGQSKQAKIIQKFQQLEDKASGVYNHTGLIYLTPIGIYVIESRQIQQRKTKAAVVVTPIEHYMDDNYKLTLLEHDREDLIPQLEQEMFKYIGTPYGYAHLTIVQAIQKLTGKFIGRKNNTDKRFICHEFSMTVWNNLVPGIFPEAYKGNVRDMWHSDKFKKKFL